MLLSTVVVPLCVLTVVVTATNDVKCPTLKKSLLRIVVTHGGSDGNTSVTLADINQNIHLDDENDSFLETDINLNAKTCPDHCFSDPSQRPKEPQPPPKDYELFPDVGFYKFHPESLSWPLARKVCKAEGGHLIILNSQKEVDVAVRILARYPSAGPWFLTGILEMGIHAEWFTMFGEPLAETGYTVIFPGENNAPGPSDFGAIHRTGGYADVTVNIQLPFICEIEL